MPTRTSRATCRRRQRVIGVMPLALSVPTSSSSSAQVAGGALIPASAKRSLLYQKPTSPKLYGMPYCLPSTW